MSNQTKAATVDELIQNELAPIPPTNSVLPEIHKSDPKQLRAEHIGALLGEAYKGASLLKLKIGEAKELTELFPDESIEIRPHDGVIYISHMALRERLWKVFGPTEVAEICRERMMRTDTNEVMVDLVLMIRGKFAAEGIGTAKYYPNNPKASFGDVVESAWSEALRRCCKKIGVGTQIWHPHYIREFLAGNAVQFGNKWYRKDDPRTHSAAEKRLTIEKEASGEIKEEEDDIPF